MSKYIDRAALFNSLSGAKTVEEIFAAIQAAPAAEDSCDSCKYERAKSWCLPCRDCKRNAPDYWERREEEEA